MDLAVHVVQHGLDHGLAPGQEQVLGVGPPGSPAASRPGCPGPRARRRPAHGRSPATPRVRARVPPRHLRALGDQRLRLGPGPYATRPRATRRAGQAGPGGSLAQVPDRAVHPVQHLRRQVIQPVDQLRGPAVGGSGRRASRRRSGPASAASGSRRSRWRRTGRPALSAATSGWSYRMTGEDSSRSRQSGGPASTGQVPMFSQAAIGGAAHSGGSVMDRNCPPGAPMSRCAAISAWRRPSSRTRSLARGGDGSPAAVAGAAPGRGPATRSACSLITPSRAAQRRTRRPARRPGLVGDVLGQPRRARCELQVLVPGQQVGNRDRGLLLPLGGVAPGRVLGPVHVQRADVLQLAGVRREALHASGPGAGGTGPAPGPARRPGTPAGTRSGWTALSCGSTWRSRAASARRTGTGPGSSAPPAGRGTAGSPRTRWRRRPGARAPGAQG